MRLWPVLRGPRSERLKKSEVTGDAQKEAIEINKSLTALGDVISAVTLGKKVPYRNHSLTMVMQDSIGGTAKTLMFVNVSPAKDNVPETTMSLKFATRAKTITRKDQAIMQIQCARRGQQARKEVKIRSPTVAVRPLSVGTREKRARQLPPHSGLGPTFTGSKRRPPVRDILPNGGKHAHT